MASLRRTLSQITHSLYRTDSHIVCMFRLTQVIVIYSNKRRRAKILISYLHNYLLKYLLNYLLIYLLTYFHTYLLTYLVNYVLT